MSVAQPIPPTLGLPKKKQLASRRLSALDAASAISRSVPNGGDNIVERWRATLARLEVPAA
ncbi:hypothetical protein [Streptomyces viridochromogenes]|uniref:hypothetical protein n=1 Tax=Streptomyces viridochromogenes TaxID=1938 RepID=UPI0031D7F8DA